MSSGGARAACQPLFWDAVADIRSTLKKSLKQVHLSTAEARSQARSPNAFCNPRFQGKCDDATSFGAEASLRWQHETLRATDARNETETNLQRDQAMPRATDARNAAKDEHDCDDADRRHSLPLACEKVAMKASHSWEWPLSRTEKKNRIVLLTEMDLLTQIEELRERADSAETKSSEKISGNFHRGDSIPPSRHDATPSRHDATCRENLADLSAVDADAAMHGSREDCLSIHPKLALRAAAAVWPR